ncbi:ankyrin [Forsythia ovata]|uniref:Ankyrin n=1 Tax=Forsythia ovata TaxID=205694 RepID=A0ABD1RND3_9LAMI
MMSLNLNPNGFSPLHLALRNNRVETAKRLVKHASELIHVQGREPITPLHYAAEINNVELLAEFLVSTPESIKNLTVHVAVRNRCAYPFGVLLGWIQRTNYKEILNWKNEEGNTVLHPQANPSQVLRLLVKNMNNVNDKNLQDMTALDIAMALPAEMNTESKIYVAQELQELCHLTRMSV